MFSSKPRRLFSQNLSQESKQSSEATSQILPPKAPDMPIAAPTPTPIPPALTASESAPEMPAPTPEAEVALSPAQPSPDSAQDNSVKEEDAPMRAKLDGNNRIEKDEKGQDILRADSVSTYKFSDIWVTPEDVSYVRDPRTKFALIPFESKDLEAFKKALDQGYTGSSSYALKFKEEAYRVERITTISGIQFNCRKMPRSTPDIYSLGLPQATVDFLTTLSQESGLILFAGPTGMGKTTSISSLLRKYLEQDGGFLYTIEDPPEMPLDGLYHAKNGALGLCKQTPVENERWEDGIKSALRSKPRYILVGEIRTPETASQVLRAATSGHLVMSTIHANSVEDALNSLIKYASGAGLAEALVTDLLARSILGVVHQKLEGTTVLRPVIHTIFANPNPLIADQTRATIRTGKISLGTLMETQASRLLQGKPLFREF